MSDQADDAQAIEERERAAAIAKARPPIWMGRDEGFCEVCGVEIPQARRDAVPGVRHCISCQEEREARCR